MGDRNNEGVFRISVTAVFFFPPAYSPLAPPSSQLHDDIRVFLTPIWLKIQANASRHRLVLAGVVPERHEMTERADELSRLLAPRHFRQSCPYPRLGQELYG